MLSRELKSIEKIGPGYILHGDAANVLLIFATDDVIRVQVSFRRDFKEESHTLVTTAWGDRTDEFLKDERTRIESLDIPCEGKNGKLVLTTGTCILEISETPSFLTLKTSDGAVVYQDLKERAFEKDHLERLAHYSKMGPINDHFYGSGEKTGCLDKKRRRFRTSSKDAIGHDPEFGDPMYKHISFYIRINEKTAYTIGLFYHNSYDSVFDMGQEVSGYWDRYYYYQTGGGDIDLFLIRGPELSAVSDYYTMLTGCCAPPTKQSLGYCVPTMYYTELEDNCDQETYRVIDKHEKEGVLTDNFWLISGYSSGGEDNLRYIFSQNYRRYPNPESFSERMDARGINVIPNLKLGILKNHLYMNLFEEDGVFIKDPGGDRNYYGRWRGGEGRFLNFTNPKARETWKMLLEDRILRTGTKTVWNDNCEMDDVEDRSAYCDFENAGGIMAELKILHPNLMVSLGKQTTVDAYLGKRPCIINRTGYAGIQRYAQAWGGDNLTDWRTVKLSIATIVGMGLSGCANMGCGIGGFAGPVPETEPLLHWVQNGIFQPRFCLDPTNNDNMMTQPWMYEENREHVKVAYAQRYRMLLYLYSLMYEANQDGMPAMCPLSLESPEDKKCYNDNNFIFMSGKSVLVANVVESEARTGTTYLPSGRRWSDMNDNPKEYLGGQTIELPVNLGNIPMFLRGSAVYVAGEDVKHIMSNRMRHVDFLINADTDTSLIFYDDGGHTEDYKKGIYAKTAVNVTVGNQTIIHFDIRGTYKNPSERVIIRLVSKQKDAFWVTADGERTPYYPVRDDWEEAGTGWYYNPSDKIIQVKYEISEEKSYDVIVSMEKSDLTGVVEEQRKVKGNIMNINIGSQP